MGKFWRKPKETFQENWNADNFDFRTREQECLKSFVERCLQHFFNYYQKIEAYNWGLKTRA